MTPALSSRSGHSPRARLRRGSAFGAIAPGAAGDRLHRQGSRHAEVDVRRRSAGRCEATIAGQEPFPDRSRDNRPCRTRHGDVFDAGLAVALAGGALGEAVGRAVCDARAAGAAEHTTSSAAEITLRTATSVRHIRTIVLPEGATGMRGFDRAGRRTAASRGTPFLLVNPNGRQTTANTSYALAA